MLKVQTMEITQEDIDKAFAVGRSATNTCVVAQAAQRHFGCPVTVGYTSITLEDKQIFRFTDYAITDMIHHFDAVMGWPEHEHAEQWKAKVKPAKFEVYREE